MVKITHPLTISITGFGRSGKNTFAEALSKYLRSIKLSPAMYSFAEELKKDCGPEIYNLYGLNSFSEITEEKNEFRHILVSRAKENRDKTRGNYYVKKVSEEIGFDWMDCDFRPSYTAIITDFRFAEFYEFGGDELNFALKNGFIIHIIKDGNGPANETEKANDTKIRQIAPLHLDKYIEFRFPDCGDDIDKLKALMTVSISDGRIANLISINTPK